VRYHLGFVLGERFYFSGLLLYVSFSGKVADEMSNEPMLKAALEYEANLQTLIKENDKVYGVGRRPKKACCRDGSFIRSRREKVTK